MVAILVTISDCMIDLCPLLTPSEANTMAASKSSLPLLLLDESFFVEEAESYRESIWAKQKPPGWCDNEKQLSSFRMSNIFTEGSAFMSGLLSIARLHFPQLVTMIQLQLPFLTFTTHLSCSISPPSSSASCIVGK